MDQIENHVANRPDAAGAVNTRRAGYLGFLCQTGLRYNNPPINLTLSPRELVIAKPLSLMVKTLVRKSLVIQERGASVFVWGTWWLMLLAALAFVWKYGSNVPFWDEWNMVAVLAKDQTVDVQWLWSEHNGHRTPFPRFLLLTLYWLTAWDFRAGMYFNTLALGALGFALIRASCVQRGRMSYADAFFPIMLLHWGHAENLLWTWQVIQVVPVLLAGILLVLIAGVRESRWPANSVLAGAGVVLLPLCGVPGLTYAPALALWFLYLVVRHWQSSDYPTRVRSVILGAAAFASLFLTILYFLNYQEHRRHLSGMHLGESLRTMLQFLTGALGPLGEVLWPYSGLGVVALLLLTALILIRMIWRHSSSPARTRPIGLLSFAAAVGCLAVSVGLGRPGYGFTPRYYLLAVPALFCTYFIWGSCPPLVARLGQLGLFVLSCLGLAMNMHEGQKYGTIRRSQLSVFERDLLAGEPIPTLLARHSPSLCPCPFIGGGVAFHDWLEYCLRALHGAGIGVFRSLNVQTPAYREIPLPVGMNAVGTMNLGQGDGGTLDAPPFAWVLPTPVYVCGIRVTYRKDQGSPDFLRVFWKRKGQNRFVEEQCYMHLLHWERQNGHVQSVPGPRRQLVTIWCYALVDGIGIHPADEPGIFEIQEVALLVPGEGDG